MSLPSVTTLFCFLISENDDDLCDKIIMGARVGAKSPDSVKIPRRAKLLQFDENRRPAYWGTWRKKSSVIRPTKPFEKDSVSTHTSRIWGSGRFCVRLSPWAMKTKMVVFSPLIWKSVLQLS
jgi:hypothetical protein